MTEARNRLMKSNILRKLRERFNSDKVSDAQSDNKIDFGNLKEGAFTAQAERADMGVQEFANHVLSHEDDFTSTTIKRANFARNAKKFND